MGVYHERRRRVLLLASKDGKLVGSRRNTTKHHRSPKPSADAVADRRSHRLLRLRCFHLCPPGLRRSKRQTRSLRVVLHATRSTAQISMA